MKLENKVAIITGASSGIGLEIAKSYVKNGAYITICGTNEEKLKNAKEEIIKSYKNAKVLSIKAAPAKALEETTDEEFINVLNINTVGTFKCTREAVKYMKENGGSIINTSSFVSIYGSSSQAAYSASKAAINGLTKSNAKELGKYKIRVNAVAPGVVMTEMVKDNCNPETIKRLNMMTPLGRGATPEDLIGLYIYLGSNDSNFTTGTIINVDGGLVL